MPTEHFKKCNVSNNNVETQNGSQRLECLKNQVLSLSKLIKALNDEVENLRIDSFILRQKLKQKGLSEVGYAFWYYVLNAIIASIFVVGITEISSNAKHPIVTKAVLWVIFIMTFLPLLTTSIAYYSQYFVISNHIADENYLQMNDKKYFAELDDEKFFPPFHGSKIKNDKGIKNIKVSLKNWFEHAKNPEILCIRAKSWATSLLIIATFSFIQYVCYKGIKSFFVNLPQKESIIINVILNIVVSIALTVMFVMIKHVLDRLFWGDNFTSIKKDMIKEKFLPEHEESKSQKNSSNISRKNKKSSASLSYDIDNSLEHFYTPEQEESIKQKNTNNSYTKNQQPVSLINRWNSDIGTKNQNQCSLLSPTHDVNSSSVHFYIDEAKESANHKNNNELSKDNKNSKGDKEALSTSLSDASSCSLVNEKNLSQGSHQET